MEATDKHSRRWSEEKISSAVLIVLVAMSIIMFAMFFTTGYDEPWEENTEFISPALTDTLIDFMFFMTGTACITVLLSVISSARCQGHVLNVSGGIPAGKIATCTALILISALVVSFFTASDSSIIINGKSYTDSWWLNITDMLIHTSEVMLAAAVIAVIYGLSGINRRIQKH